MDLYDLIGWTVGGDRHGVSQLPAGSLDSRETHVICLFLFYGTATILIKMCSQILNQRI